jgi:hypothetical protein
MHGYSYLTYKGQPIDTSKILPLGEIGSATIIPLPEDSIKTSFDSVTSNCSTVLPEEDPDLPVEKKLSVHFFDNDHQHHSACIEAKSTDIDLTCIKVDETPFKSLQSSQHYRVIDNIFNESISPGLISCAIWILAVLQYNNCTDLFDEVAGLKCDQINPHADLYVFDWDRTITQAEGFLGRGGTFGEFRNSYWQAVHYSLSKKTFPGIANFSPKIRNAFRDELAAYHSGSSLAYLTHRFNSHFTPDNYTCILCGGPRRYAKLKQVLGPTVDRAYIITHRQ